MRQGDSDGEALNRLFARYVPSLNQWARGRLPNWARDISDTHDLVQETVVHVFKKLDNFEYRGEGALLAYLRQALMNRIRNEIRRAWSRPATELLDPAIEDPSRSPVDAAISTQEMEHYEAAIGRLRSDERELVIARVELGLTYPEIATALKRPTADAARMAVGRALVRLAQEMGK